MNQLLNFSGGIGSWAAGMRLDNPDLLFADTFIEDADLYRFLIEGACVIGGGKVEDVRELADEARMLPDVEIVGEEQRRQAILELRAKAVIALPKLHWIYDGRTPWELFRQVRLIGNSQFDPCSKILKRDLMGKWRDANFHPGNVILYFGIDWTEEHRIFNVKRAMGFRWDVRAPLCVKPWKLKSELLAELEQFGIAAPRLYGMGFSHNNCGGFCIKAGHKATANLLDKMPIRYAYHERKESELSPELKGATVLRYRKGGKTIRLSLKDLRLRIEAGTAKLPEEDGAKGCGCAME